MAAPMDVIALNYVLIALHFSAKLCVFAFQIRCAELAANRFIHGKLQLHTGDLCLENGSRTPKADVTAALAEVLDVSPKALDVPDIDSDIGLMHTLFTLEDRYGLEICECEDEVHLRVHIHKGRDAAALHRMLAAWGAVAAKLKAGEITQEEYDRWRYYYPKYDTSGQWHKITPSQELSDLLLADLKEHTEK